MRSFALVLSVFATACHISEEHFVDCLDEEACDIYIQCQADFSDDWIRYDDRTDCLDAVEDEPVPSNTYPDCTYNQDKAKDCLKAYKDLSCTDYENGNYPDECQDVYTGTCGTDAGDGGGGDGGGGDGGGGDGGNGDGGGGNGGN